jgi:VanZ family protein
MRDDRRRRRRARTAHRTLTRVCRLAAILLFGAIVVFTLGPLRDRPETGYPPQDERFAAYALLGVLFALGFPRRRMLVAISLVGASIVLELSQLAVPGRDAGLADALAKASGAVVGVVLVAALQAAARVARP